MEIGSDDLFVGGRVRWVPPMHPWPDWALPQRLPSWNQRVGTIVYIKDGRVAVVWDVEIETAVISGDLDAMWLVPAWALDHAFEQDVNYDVLDAKGRTVSTFLDLPRAVADITSQTLGPDESLRVERVVRTFVCGVSGSTATAVPHG